MPTGTYLCCLEEKPLRDSHLIRRARINIYAVQTTEARSASGNGVVLPTDRKVHYYVFCKDCEDIFNFGSETWMVPKLARQGGRFHCTNS
jgi:hypothetical protein